MPSRQPIKVLITDLDNTLYDWVAAWYASFSALLGELVQISGIPRAQLILEIKAVHQRHRTAEYAFLIQELPSLQKLHPGAMLPKLYASAIQAYRSERERTLVLYPTVRESLEQLRAAGTRIVAYTESMALYTNYRIKHLKLDALLDYVYTPKDHDIPENLDPLTLSLFPAARYDLVHAEHRYTAPGVFKPSTTVLLQIMQDLGIQSRDCVYVGDNLMKDVAMANDARVTSIHAVYGQAHERKQYELLKAVTHWSDEDVRREAAPKAVNAAVTLQKRFNELFDAVEPRPF